MPSHSTWETDSKFVDFSKKTVLLKNFQKKICNRIAAVLERGAYVSGLLWGGGNIRYYNSRLQ